MMIILKIIFLALLCLPAIYLVGMFTGRLVDEAKNNTSEAASQTKRRMRNVIRSDRNIYEQSYYQNRLENEVPGRGVRRNRKGRER